MPLNYSKQNDLGMGVEVGLQVHENLLMNNSKYNKAKDNFW